MNQQPNQNQQRSNNRGRGGRRNSRRTPKKPNQPDRPFSSASNQSMNQNGNQNRNWKNNRQHPRGEQGAGYSEQNNRESMAPIDEDRIGSQSVRDPNYRDFSPQRNSHSARDQGCSDRWSPDDREHRRSYSPPRNDGWHRDDFENDGQGPSRINYDDYDQGQRNSYSPNRQYENESSVRTYEDDSRRNTNYQEEQRDTYLFRNNNRLGNQDSPPGNNNAPSKKKKKNRLNNTARWNKALKQEIKNGNGRGCQQRTPTKSEGPSAGRFINDGYQESERNGQNHGRRSRSPGYRNAPPPSYGSQDVRNSGIQSRRPDSPTSSRISRPDQNQDRYPDQRSQHGFSPVRSVRQGRSEDRFVNDNGWNSNDRNGDGYRDQQYTPPRYFEGFQSQDVRNDSRMSHRSPNRSNVYHSPPRNQDRYRAQDDYRSCSPPERFGGPDCYDGQRRFDNGNQGNYSPNPSNWQYDERGRSNSPRGQGTSNFRANSWSPIPGEKRCRSPSAQGGYNQVRNRSPSPHGQGSSSYHQDNWQPRPEPYRNRSPSPGPRDNWSPISEERRCRSPSRHYEDDTKGKSRNSWSPPQNWNDHQCIRSLSPEGPSTSRAYEDRSRYHSPSPRYQYDNRSYSPEGKGTSSSYQQNSWSPSPAPYQGQKVQERNRSGSLQGPGPSNCRENSWSPSPAPATGPQFQDRNRSGSLQGPDPSNNRDNSWSPRPEPHQGYQDRNRSGSLQEPGPSNNRDSSWSPLPGERRYYRSPSPNNQQRRQSTSPTRSLEPRLPVSGFQQPVAPLQRRTESPYRNERQKETPKDRIVEKEPEEEEEEEPFDEEELRELFAALMREEPMRRIEPSDGKWQLSITETCCDPSFLWDNPKPKGKVSQATRRFVTKDYVNPHLRNNCIFCEGKHKPDECPNVVSVEDRRDILAFYERCIRCLRRHREDPCPKKNQKACHYCFDEDPEEPKHNSSVCRTAYIPEHMLESNQ